MASVGPEPHGRPQSRLASSKRETEALRAGVFGNLECRVGEGQFPLCSACGLLHAECACAGRRGQLGPD